MVRFSRIAALGLCIVFVSCTANEKGTANTTTAAASDPVADEQALRAVNTAWFEAHRTGNVDGIVGLYAPDAIVSAPGMEPVRGEAAIRVAFATDMQAMSAAGLSQAAGATPQFGVSGDLGYEWNSYTVTDKSGKTVDRGKYVSVFGRRDGKWVIISDIWNSDMPAPAPN